MADALDSDSSGRPCKFKSCYSHQKDNYFGCLFLFFLFNMTKLVIKRCQNKEKTVKIMSVKYKRPTFTKRQYVLTLTETVEFLTKTFGYKKPPKIKETVLPKNCFMMYRYDGKSGIIYYNYKEFLHRYHNKEQKLQEMIVANDAAHEMRHFYQYKQVTNVNIQEKYSLRKKWAKSIYTPNRININDKKYIDSYLKDPLEVDAFLFGYQYCAVNYDVALICSIQGKKHYGLLKNYCREYYGKIDKDLFNKKIKKAIG